MIIKTIEYFRLDFPLTVPYTIAYETVDHATNIILKIITNTGLTGWGCAAPDIAVTGESTEDVISNINEVIIPTLKDQSPFQIVKTDYFLKQRLKNSSSTRAMVDMALHDLLARKAKLP